jgi:hypothetical protein
MKQNYYMEMIKAKDTCTNTFFAIIRICFLAYDQLTIDNIFIDTYKFINYTVFPLHNGLSDYDAQLLIIKDVKLQLQNHRIHTTRNINKYSTEKFKIRLSYESWDSIFGNNSMDVDSLFNLFLNNYLRIFYTSFPP